MQWHSSLTILTAPKDWLNEKIIYYWRQKKNDAAIAKSVTDDIEHNEEMKGKYGIRYVFLVFLPPGTPMETDGHSLQLQKRPTYSKQVGIKGSQTAGCRRARSRL
jgi:hypothetical protein